MVLVPVVAPADGTSVDLEDIGSSVESLSRVVKFQKGLFQSQIDRLQVLVVVQWKLTGVNPLSQEMVLHFVFGAGCGCTLNQNWHDWDMLKSLLSIRLKQVLSEYPEAKVASGDGPQPSSLSGETYPELVRRLDEALLSFIEGPPFTLQWLCEILLTPKSTYRNLSKLALALEKNLLVTSTLTICCGPYPTSVVQKPAETENSEELHRCADPVPIGVENMAADVDEEMVEADIDEDAPSEETDPQNIDTEMQVESVSEASERNAESSDPTPPTETCTSEQKNTGTPQEP